MVPNQVVNVCVDFTVNDGAAEVIGPGDVVFNSVMLRFGCFYGVGCGALFIKSAFSALMRFIRRSYSLETSKLTNLISFPETSSHA